MGKTTKISWTDASWNPFIGCKKISDGCKFCYMYRDRERYGYNPAIVMRSKPKTFDAPLKWKEGKLIFICSWSDFFIKEADEWRNEAWDIIKATPQHTYQILTKRPERIFQCLPADWGKGYDNVWLGVSIESNKEILRVFQLASIPSKIRFVSAEPLLNIVTLFPFLNLTMEMRTGKPGSAIDWVIIGGESGNETGKYRYRKCEIEWIMKMINNCKEANIPVFVKQLGTHLAKELKLKDRHGRNINEFPKDLQMQEIPVYVSNM